MHEFPPASSEKLDVSQNAKAVHAGEMISVRGYGKFTYDGLQGTSKKGKLNVRVRIYR